MNYLEAIKYPKTPHFDFSQSLQNDDRRLITTHAFENADRIIVTLKLDGENSNIYNNYYHPRSVIDDGHESRNWLKGFIPNFQYKLPSHLRLCGENMYAEHSIRYENLESFFYAFSIWNDKNQCFSWDDFVGWCEYLNILHVPVLYDGVFDYEVIKEIYEDLDFNKQEGIVCRVAHSFSYEDFDLCVAKAIRPKHVSTDEHWKKTWKPNKLKK